MSSKTIRTIGAAVALIALIPAAGPYYLGIIRDDIHAHSKFGDLGLQAITFAGLFLVAAGLILTFRGTPGRPDKEQ